MNIKDAFKKLIAILPVFIIVLNSNAATLALSTAEVNSIYYNTVWYSSSSGSPLSTCGVSPGNGSPEGAAFPNLDPTAMATAIDTWVPQQNPNSELKGLGSTIVASAKASNVNPFLIVAIAHEESSLSDPGDFNVQNGNNSFGRSATESQPHFKGARLWYKWSSVKASVDSTAPENQGAGGGGDMATYLRDVYASEIDQNNLIALFMKYAPPGDNNNTEQYIANVKGWIDGLVALSNGQAAGSSDSSSSCSTSCNDVTGPNAAILCEAQKYNGIYYRLGGGHETYSNFRQICPESSIAGAAGSSSTGDPGPCATDCSGLVSVALDAVYNKNYVWTVNGQMVGDGSQYWQSIPVDQAQAGDIVTTPEHVEIVVKVSGDTVYTFGSHHTGSKTSQITTSSSYWTGGAYRWNGPTS